MLRTPKRRCMPKDHCLIAALIRDYRPVEPDIRERGGSRRLVEFDFGCVNISHWYEPIECLFCRHDRVGQGPICHRALEKDWDSVAGRRLVNNWITRVGLTKRYGGQGR